MSEKFRQLLVMIMAEGIHFTMDKGFGDFYYLVYKDGETIVWELDDRESNVYLYDFQNNRYVYPTPSPRKYIDAIETTLLQYALDKTRSVVI